MLNQISFKANFVQNATVLKRSSENTFEDKSVALAQLNPDCARDMQTVDEVRAEWSASKNFVPQIKAEMVDCTDFFEHGNKKFFALTTQKQNFENLESKKVLALSEVIDGEHNLKIKFLQVHPQHKRGKKTAEFKHIGTAILNSFKELFPQRDIVLQTSDEGKKFYLAHGFEKLKKDWMILRLK